MKNVDRHLRIPGDEPIRVEATYLLGKRYIKSLGKSAQRADLLDSTIVQRIHAAHPGDLLLLGDEYEHLANQEEVEARVINEASINGDRTVLGATRQESARGVKFGQLLITGDQSVPGHDYVAIKPTAVERAVREAAASRFVNSRSVDTGMETYQPLGFLKTKQGVQLITRFAGSTLTFDNILWQDSEVAGEAQVADALAKSAISLAVLHAGYQMSHGDAQPKNMAWHNRLNEPWSVDLEDARRHIANREWDFPDEIESDLATLMLYQPVRRSEDLFELVADKYFEYYQTVSATGGPPIEKGDIVKLRGRKLQPLPRISVA